MLFALIFPRSQRASTFDISAERNVWLRSYAIIWKQLSLRSSAIVCDHMELPSLWPKSPDKVLILQNLIWQDSLVSDQFKTSSIGLFGTLYNYPPKGR